MLTKRVTTLFTKKSKEKLFKIANDMSDKEKKIKVKPTAIIRELVKNFLAMFPDDQRPSDSKD